MQYIFRAPGNMLRRFSCAATPLAVFKDA